MVSDLKFNDLIQRLMLDVFLEKNCSVCEEFKNSNGFVELKEINRILQIPEEGFKIEVYKFRRYDATDHIDDLNLCENYLNFCIDFEQELAPAILITIIYRNNYIDKLKINGGEYDANSEKFIDFLLRRITQAVSNFFN